jgi:hypothetical protein
MVARCLLAPALTSWDAAVAALPPMEGSDDSPTDGVIGTARESDPVQTHQHGGTGSHLPPTSYNVQLVGKLRVHDATSGIVADVGELGNYAYLAWFSPGYAADEAGGAYLIDISDPVNPREVGFIAAFQGSFVGEGVQAVHINSQSFASDILAVNDEICSAGGLGGVSLSDITNPLTATLLPQDFGDTTDALGNLLFNRTPGYAFPARLETPGTLSPTLATSAPRSRPRRGSTAGATSTCSTRPRRGRSTPTPSPSATPARGHSRPWP